MDTVILVKIESLHARMVEPEGMKLNFQGRNISTGAIVAHLDASAPVPANCGMLNLNTGRIRLHWSVIVTMPFSADAFIAGFVDEEDSPTTKITFEEEGCVDEDDSGFDAVGPGKIAPGSLLSQVKVARQPNFVEFIPSGKGREKEKMTATLARGESARCNFLPKSYLDLTLPKSLGGGNQRLHLIGGFFLVPVMTLKQPKNSNM